MGVKHVITAVVFLAIGAFVGIKYPQYVPFIGGGASS